MSLLGPSFLITSCAHLGCTAAILYFALVLHTYPQENMSQGISDAVFALGDFDHRVLYGARALAQLDPNLDN